MNIRLTLFFVLLLSGYAASAATCTKTGSVCVDSTPCKMIGGVQVCLTDPAINATCWQYQDTYSCLAQNAVNYCAAISSTPGCAQVNSVCATPSSSGCTRWTNTYRCGNSFAPPANTVQLNTSYTIATDTINASACNALASNPTCRPAAHVCVEPAGTRIINGLSVYKDCWAWRDDYTCLGSVQSDCPALAAKGCTLNSSTCAYPSGATAANCQRMDKTYTCPGSTSTAMDCGSQICANGNCFDTSHTPDSDIASVVIAQEIGRQGSVYMDGNQRIFGGTLGTCSDNLFVNCCKPSGGASNNSSLGSNIISTLGGQTIKIGSSYMYDAISQTAQTGIGAMSTVAKGVTSVVNTTSGAVSSVKTAISNTAQSIGSVFGIGSAAGTGAAAGAGAAAGVTPAPGLSLDLYGFSFSFSSSGSLVVEFSLPSFAISVGMMVIQELMSCDQSEKILGQKIGASLCRFNGTVCSNDFLGICLSYTSYYCCFNSKMAKILNNAGVAQLGKPPLDCSGMTTDEFSRLNLSLVDMSEFINDIMSNIKLPSVAAINTDVNYNVQQRLNNYYTRGKQ